MHMAFVQGLRHGVLPNQCRVGIIADLDKRSKHKEKSAWHSIYMTVSQHYHREQFCHQRMPCGCSVMQGTLSRKEDRYTVDWDAPVDVTTTVSGERDGISRVYPHTPFGLTAA